MIDERLERARADYRSAPAGMAVPAMAASWSRKGALAAVVAVAAAALVIWGIVALVSRGDEQAIVVATAPSEAPTVAVPTATPPEPSSNGEATLTVEPDGPYQPGDAVTVRLTEPDSADWLNSRLSQCLQIWDDSEPGGEYCDTYEAFSASSQLGDARWQLVLSGEVLTPSGYRTCDDPETSCRLMLGGHHGLISSHPLDIKGPPLAREAALEVEHTESPGGYTVTPVSLEAHPSWDEFVTAYPDESGGYDPFWVTVCAFDAEPLELPDGSTIPGRPSSVTRSSCDDRSIAIDRSSVGVSNRPFDITLARRWLIGLGGWGDCLEGCYVVVSRFVVAGVVDDETQFALEGGDEFVAAAVLPPDDRLVATVKPTIEILTPGAHRRGDVIEVRISGLPEGATTTVGECHVDEPWGCFFQDAAFDLGNGTHQIPLAPFLPHDCGRDECYLELSSDGGEAVPPFAVTPLPMETDEAPDVALTVDPPGPIEPGATVTVSVRADAVVDAATDRPRLCARLDTGTQAGGEFCDSLALASSVDERSGVTAGGTVTWEAILAGDVFTPDGYRNCSDADVTCRLEVLADYEGGVVVSAPLEFTAPAAARQISIGVSKTDIPGWYELDATGLKTAEPTSATVCEFGGGGPVLSPAGDDLRAPKAGPRSRFQDCDGVGRIDPDQLTFGSRAATRLIQGGGFLGSSGWTDCATATCFLTIWFDDGHVAATLLPADPRLADEPRPSIRILTSGPHLPGDEVEIEVANLPEGFVSDIGICDPTWTSRCGYLGIDITDGVRTVTINELTSVRCTDCYLELDSIDEGLPPLAVTPLPMKLD